MIVLEEETADSNVPVSLQLGRPLLSEWELAFFNIHGARISSQPVVRKLARCFLSFHSYAWLGLYVSASVWWTFLSRRGWTSLSRGLDILEWVGWTYFPSSVNARVRVVRRTVGLLVAGVSHGFSSAVCPPTSASSRQERVFYPLATFRRLRSDTRDRPGPRVLL